MKRRHLRAFALLALALPGGGLLAACGSSTKTVSAANTPAPSQTTATAAQTTGTTTSPPKTTTTAPTPTTTSGGTSAPTTTRTAPAPAFVQQETHAEGQTAAAALVRARGYAPANVSEYHEGQTLKVLVGTKTGSGGSAQQAFFFVGDRYIGTDAKGPSANVKVVSQSDTSVTLAYSLYRRGSPAGQATVEFQLNNGKLTPLGTIPPAASTNGASRN